MSPTKNIVTTRTQTIDSIIDYFKAELEILSNETKNLEEQNRFSINMIILVFSGIAIIFSAIIQVFKIDYPTIILSSVLVIIILCVVILCLLIPNKIEADKYLDKRIKLQLILRYLLHLKATRTEINTYLSNLKEKIKSDFRDPRIKIKPGQSNWSIYKETQKYEQDRLSEYLAIIDTINKKIFENDQEIENYRKQRIKEQVIP